MHPLFSSYFSETWNFLTNFQKNIKYQFSENPSLGADSVLVEWQTEEGRTEMTKLLVNFLYFANTPKTVFTCMKTQHTVKCVIDYQILLIWLTVKNGMSLQRFTTSCVPMTLVCSATLRFSLNLIVAATWKTMDTSRQSSSLSCADIPSPGCWMSPCTKETWLSMESFMFFFTASNNWDKLALVITRRSKKAAKCSVAMLDIKSHSRRNYEWTKF